MGVISRGVSGEFSECDQTRQWCRNSQQAKWTRRLTIHVTNEPIIQGADSQTASEEISEEPNQKKFWLSLAEVIEGIRRTSDNGESESDRAMSNENEAKPNKPNYEKCENEM